MKLTSNLDEDSGILDEFQLTGNNGGNAQDENTAVLGLYREIKSNYYLNLQLCATEFIKDVSKCKKKN